MKKIAVLSFLALAAAACADSPTMPGDPGEPLLSHTPPEHANTSFDLHDVVDLEASAAGSDVTLTWTSADDYTDPGFFAADGGDELTKWHFEVHRRYNDADDPEFEQIADTETCAWNAGDALLECSYTDPGLDDGSYSYFVKAFAREGSPPNHEIHHSHDSNVVDVTVGAVFHVQFTYSPGQSVISDHADGWTESIDDLSGQPAKWDLEFVILKNLVPVTECAPTGDFAAVTIEGVQNWDDGAAQSETTPYSPNSCEDGVYQFELDNDARGGRGARFDSDGTITVELDGEPVENEVAYTSVGNQ